jgi:hypothetical protein
LVDGKSWSYMMNVDGPLCVCQCWPYRCCLLFQLYSLTGASLAQGDWFCPLCVAAGITTKPEPMPPQLKQLSALKPPKSSFKARPSSTSKLGHKMRGSGSGEGFGVSGQGSLPPPSRPAGTGRVHMSAPTAPRAPRLGRPGARSNKNKRLFEGEEGALVNGQKLFYRTTQVRVWALMGCVGAWGGLSAGWSHCWCWEQCCWQIDMGMAAQTRQPAGAALPGHFL